MIGNLRYFGNDSDMLSFSGFPDFMGRRGNLTLPAFNFTAFDARNFIFLLDEHLSVGGTRAAFMFGITAGRGTNEETFIDLEERK
jgi:hypothetical protein